MSQVTVCYCMLANVRQIFDPTSHVFAKHFFSLLLLQNHNLLAITLMLVICKIEKVPRVFKVKSREKTRQVRESGLYNMLCYSNTCNI